MASRRPLAIALNLRRLAGPAACWLLPWTGSTIHERNPEIKFLCLPLLLLFGLLTNRPASAHWSPQLVWKNRGFPAYRARQLAISSDGRLLAVASGAGVGVLWEKAPVRVVPAGGGEWQIIFQCIAQVRSLAFSRDGKYLAVGGAAWQLPDGARKASEDASEPAEAEEEECNHEQEYELGCARRGFPPAAFAVWDLASGTPVVELKVGKGEGKAVNAVAFSPDGLWVAAGGVEGASQPEEGERYTIRLWRVRDWQLVRTIVTQEEVTSLAFSPDSQILCSGGRKKKIRLWNVETGAMVKELGQQMDSDETQAVASLAFSADGDFLAACLRHLDPNYFYIGIQFHALAWFDPELRGGRAEIRRVTDGSLVKVLPCEDIELVSFSPEEVLLTGPFPVRSWRLPDFQQVSELLPPELPWQELTDYGEHTDGLAVSWEKALVAFSTDNGLSVFRFTPQGLQWVQSFSWISASIGDLSFSSDGRHLATVVVDQTTSDVPEDVAIWRTVNGEVVRRKTLWGGEPLWARLQDEHCSVVLRGGFWVAVHDWNLEGVERRCVYRGSDYACAFSPGGQYMVTSGSNHYGAPPTPARLLGSEDCCLLLTFDGNVINVAFSNDERWLAAEAADGSVRLWLLPEGREVRRLPPGNGRVDGLALSGDGKVLACALASVEDYKETTKLQLWRVEDGSLLSTFVLQECGSVERLGFSPDGQLLGSLCYPPSYTHSETYSQSLQLYRVRDGRLLSSLWADGNEEPVASFAFSPDGAYLALGGQYGSLSLWRLPRVE